MVLVAALISKFTQSLNILQDILLNSTFHLILYSPFEYHCFNPFHLFVLHCTQQSWLSHTVMSF